MALPRAIRARAFPGVDGRRHGTKYGSGYLPPAASGLLFTDVPADYWAVDWIEQLALEDIARGCGNGNFCPDTQVTRDQMAVLLQKLFGFPLP